MGDLRDRCVMDRNRGVRMNMCFFHCASMNDQSSQLETEILMGEILMQRSFLKSDLALGGMPAR